MRIFTLVRHILENRRVEASDDPANPRLFSRALREPTQDEIFLACLRKIEKSAKRWNKEYGERGYLNFISNYIL